MLARMFGLRQARVFAGLRIVVTVGAILGIVVSASTQPPQIGQDGPGNGQGPGPGGFGGGRGGPGGPGGFGGGRGGPGGRFRPDPTSFLMNIGFDPEFKERISLTAEQEEELGTIRREFFTMRGLPEDERQAKMKEMEARAQQLLTPDQTKIWEEQKVIAVKRQADREAERAAAGDGAPPVGGPPGPPPSVEGAPGPRRPRPAMPEAPADFKPGDVRASFSGAGGVPVTEGAEPKLTFNFRYAPWADVLKMFAEVAGLTPDLTETPPGTFNYFDERQYTPTQALDVLNGYLISKGYILIRRDRFLVCINIDDGIPPNLVPPITIDELPKRGRNELVSVVVPLQGVDVTKIVGELKELLGPQGKVAALANTNSIVVTDLASNVERIHSLLTLASTVDNRDTAFKAIPLKHITAVDAERMVRRLFGLTQSVTLSTATSTASSTPQPPFGGGFWNPGFGGPPGMFGGDFRGRDGRDGRDSRDSRDSNNSSRSSGSAAPAPSAPSPYAGKIQVTADTRTNSLLVTASAALCKVVEEAVKTLDTDTAADGSKIVQSNSPVTLKVYSVAGGDVARVAQTLAALMPGLMIIDDPKSAKLHVQATEEEHREVEQLIKQFSGDGASSVFVITLRKLEPVGTANTLNNLFSSDGARAPTIEADSQGRRLMVRGTPDQIVQVKALLSNLGELGEGEAAPGSRGPVRRLNLGGRDPEEFLPLLKDFWSSSGPNPIRIVIPSQPNPIRDRKVPAVRNDPRNLLPQTQQPADERRTETNSIPTRTASMQRTAENAESAVPPAKLPTNDFDSFLESFLEPMPAEKSEPVTSETEPKAATNSDQMPIGMSVVGNELIVSSEDEAALDRLETIFENLTSAIPARTRWTVFYLRTADATETAQMIERLFPQSTVTASTASSEGMLSSFSSGLSSVGRGLMNVTGLNNTLGGTNLRIVTDIRANALFVTGPADKIAEVEAMLQLLDATDLPESLRDRVPRSIPVKYADVDEVAEVIEDVFKESMQAEQPAAQGGRNFNPLAMLMAGAAGGQGKARGPELTLGVDRRTSHLIVSCNNTLFTQVEAQVQEIDRRAQEARQSVQVVSLAAADPMLVSATLGALMPKVTVSGSRGTRVSSSRSRDRSSNGSSSGGSSSDGNRDGEALRRMMEFQSMRNSSGGGEDRGRSFRGFGGGFPGGGFPGGGFPGSGNR